MVDRVADPCQFFQPFATIRGIEQRSLAVADQALQYGFVVETMDRIRRSGIEKLGMVTEPTRAR